MIIIVINRNEDCTDFRDILFGKISGQYFLRFANSCSCKVSVKYLHVLCLFSLFFQQLNILIDNLIIKPIAIFQPQHSLICQFLASLAIFPLDFLSAFISFGIRPNIL